MAVLDTYTGYGICDAVYRPDFVAEDGGGILLRISLEVDNGVEWPEHLVDHSARDGLELLENRPGPGWFDVYEYIRINGHGLSPRQSGCGAPSAAGCWIHRSREGGEFLEHPDGGGLSEEGADSYFDLFAVLVVGPGFPVFPAAPVRFPVLIILSLA